MKSEKIPNSNHTNNWYEIHSGLRHPENGKVYDFTSRCYKYYKNGQLHREDGPAIEYNDDYRSDHKWYLNGLYQIPSMMPINIFMLYCNYIYKNSQRKL